MGLNLRKYSTGLHAQAYTYENIQLECLHHGPTTNENIRQNCMHRPTPTKIFSWSAYIMGLHLRKYSTELPPWAYIYENIQQGCLHRISQGIFNLD